MNRAFLSLYILIVFCVALFGWGLDKLWQHFSPPPPITAAQHDLFALVERAIIHAKSPTEARLETATLSASTQSHIELLSLDDFANSPLSEQLSSGEPLRLHNSLGELQLYKRINSQADIIRLTLPAPSAQKGSYLYEILLTVFYGSIGLVVFIWVWPLMRDVRKLERHTQHIGKRSLPEPVSVLPGSAVSHLASAFNQMAERIKELLASHKEITYAVSHELRTPLARMKFALAMLKNADPSDQQAAQTSSLSQDIDEMDALITQLLTYAGYEQEDGPLKQESGDMAFLISELIQRAKASHQNTDVQIALDCPNQTTHVYCDWHLMERAIFNLIHNALRFAQTTIRVTLKQTQADFIITVEDDGPGIPAEQRTRVFESFVRLESKPNAQVRGFGLGLAIVQRVLKWHDGKASVGSSAQLGGAQFCLQWPKAHYRD
ncbi:MAG TPA: ATP-binding protein [Marinagarivorans sp.]